MALLLSFLVPLGFAYKGVRFGGYFFSGLLLILWSFASIPVLFRECRIAFKGTAPKLCCAGLLVFAGMMLLRQESHFNVLDDELNLQNTALTMHSDREVSIAKRGYWLEGDYVIMDASLDKRGFIFPFVVSLVHDLFGYDVRHVFGLNVLLALAAVFVGYLFFTRLATPFAASLALLPLTAAPVFVDCARGAGFETMNFLFLGILGLAALAYLDRNGACAEESCLVLTAAVLAYLRYESVVAVLPVALLVLYTWRRHKQCSPGPGLILAPLLFVPFVWLFLCTVSRVGSWELERSQDAKVFAVDYLGRNLVDALAFYFDPSWMQANDFFLTVAGGLGVLLFFICSKRSKAFSDSAEDMFVLGSEWRCAVYFWLLVFVGLLLVIFAYFWSSFLDILSQRMSLPLIWLLSFGLLVLLDRIIGRVPRGRLLAAVLVFAGLLFSTIPSLNRYNARYDANHLARIQTWKLAWGEAHLKEGERYFFIDDNPEVWTALRQSAIELKHLDERLARLYLHWQANSFKDCYVVRYMQRGKAGQWVGGEVAGLEALELEAMPAAEFEVSPAYVCRIYRIRAIHCEDSLYDDFWTAQANKSNAESVYSSFIDFLTYYLP